MTTYQDIRPLIQPGDIIAFGGRGHFSNIIKFITASKVSHVGIIMETKLLLGEDSQPGKIVDILESTTLMRGKSGVQRTRMSDRVADYDGEIWWLGLAPHIRAQMDMKAYFDFCLNELGKPYDMLQAILAGLHIPQPWSASKRFCSEVAAAAMRKSGIRQMQVVNPASVKPSDLCAMRLYSQCIQIKGTPTKIEWNTREPWVANF